jgi:hypothetical protein
MSLIVEEYVSLDPVDVGFFRPMAIVPAPDSLADLIEEFGFRRRCRRTDRGTAGELTSVHQVYLGVFHGACSRSERAVQEFKVQGFKGSIGLSRGVELGAFHAAASKIIIKLPIMLDKRLHETIDSSEFVLGIYP